MDISTEPTPTFEEFLWSHSPSNLMRYDDLEDVLYKTIDFGLLLGPIYSKAIYMWAWQGVPMFAERGALYLATQESWGMYRLMTKPARLARHAASLGRLASRSAPMAIPLAATAASYDVASALYSETAYQAGADIDPASTKPAWIPLPLWILMH